MASYGGAMRAIVLILLAGLGLACEVPDRPELYSARGVVKGVLADENQVTIDHEEIEGLMPAMTMNFDVPDAALLEQFESGQIVDFALRRRGGLYQIIGMNVIGEAKPGENPLAVLATELQVAPPFTLIDQDGARRSLSDFAGRAIFVDFIFTHCPGPCPILTATMAALQEKLTAEQRAQTQLVSISLDPERDTPDAMRAYALARGADFTGWAFLTGTSAEIDPVLAGYGVGKVSGDEIEHTVVTFLIDREGRIAKRYLGAKHGADELLVGLAEVL